MTHALNLAELCDATVHALYVIDEKALNCQLSEGGRAETRRARREEGEARVTRIGR